MPSRLGPAKSAGKPELLGPLPAESPLTPKLARSSSTQKDCRVRQG